MPSSRQSLGVTQCLPLISRVRSASVWISCLVKTRRTMTQSMPRWSVNKHSFLAGLCHTRALLKNFSGRFKSLGTDKASVNLRPPCTRRSTLLGVLQRYHSFAWGFRVVWELRCRFLQNAFGLRSLFSARGVEPSARTIKNFAVRMRCTGLLGERRSIIDDNPLSITLTRSGQWI